MTNILTVMGGIMGDLEREMAVMDIIIIIIIEEKGEDLITNMKIEECRVEEEEGD